MRSSMCQEHLVGLSLMSIGFQVLQDIDIEVVIKGFAEKKQQKSCWSVKQCQDKS